MNAESSSSNASSPRPELILVLKVHSSAEKARSTSSVLGLISSLLPSAILTATGAGKELEAIV